MPDARPAGGLGLERTVAAAAAATLAVVLFAHVRGYFFLLDDFVILGEVTSRSIGTLLGRTLFNFYRPAEHLWVKAQFAVFGWSRPGGYVALSIALHAVCALLVRALVLRASGDRRVALMAATLFLVSPWATEPYFWMSGGFDLIAAAGLLTALTLGLAGVDAARPRSAALAFGGGVAAALLAMLGKEIGVLAPALFVALLAAARGPRALTRRRALIYAGLLSLAALGYLGLREHLLPGLGGGYGDLGALVGRGSLPFGALSYARALLLLPLPSPSSMAGRWLAIAATALYVAAVAVAAWRAAIAGPRIAALCVAAIVLSVAPVLWVTLIEGSSAGNRFLYFAGAWFSWLLAAGLARSSGRVRGWALATIVVVGLGSVIHQARIWREAARLSRASIDQMRRFQGSAAPLFVANLPGAFGEGPYVMNTLAFRYYFQGTLPPVEARTMTLRFEDGAPAFAFWNANAAPAAGAETVTLSLPVWMRESRLSMALEQPAAGAVVEQPFAVAGWAIDTNARAGTGVESVRIYAYPVPGGEADAVFLGQARYGSINADVASKYGSRFDRAGFTLDASGLRPGRYRLAAFVRSAVTRTTETAWTGAIVVR